MDLQIATLMQPDAVMPAQFYAATARNVPSQRGEWRLLLALLEDAIHCYQKYARSRKSRERRLFEDARYWIMDERESHRRRDQGNGTFSFEQVCSILGIDPEYLRAGLRRWHAAALAAAHPLR